jgi:hypothetical protein
MSDTNVTPDSTNNNWEIQRRADQPMWLSNFVSIYSRLDTQNLYLLKDIYHKEVTFIDPIHEIQGFEALSYYFTNLYQNLTACDFDIYNIIWQDHQATIYWQMSYQHAKLNGGEVVHVSGSSHIRGQDNKVIYHRDYLDLGAMLYEHIPLLGRLCKLVKKRAASS